MTEYTQLFMSEGYEAGEDIENLKGLTKKDLQGMGITKRGEFVGTFGRCCVNLLQNFTLILTQSFMHLCSIWSKCTKL